MELWVAKDSDGDTFLYEAEPVTFTDGAWDIPCENDMETAVEGGFLAEKIGAILANGQKALVRSFNVKTGLADLDIWKDPYDQLTDTVSGFLSGSVTKAELGRVLKRLSKTAK